MSFPKAMRETLWHYVGFVILILSIIWCWLWDYEDFWESFQMPESKVYVAQWLWTALMIVIGLGVYSDFKRRLKSL